MVRLELSLIFREMVLLAEKILEQKPREWGLGGRQWAEEWDCTGLDWRGRGGPGAGTEGSFSLVK